MNDEQSTPSLFPGEKYTGQPTPSGFATEKAFELPETPASATEKYSEHREKRSFSPSLRRAAYSWSDEPTFPTYPSHQDGLSRRFQLPRQLDKQPLIIVAGAVALLVLMTAIWLAVGRAAQQRTTTAQHGSGPQAAGGVLPGSPPTFTLPATSTIGTQPGAVATATAQAVATAGTNAVATPAAGATTIPGVAATATVVPPPPPPPPPAPPQPTPTPGFGVNVVGNPSFEAGSADWFVWPGSSGNDGDASSNQTAMISAHSGSWYRTHWKAAPYEVTTYQTIYNIPNGTYTASAWVETSCDTTGQYNQFVVRNPANNQNIAIMNVPSCFRNWTLITLNNISVTNNQADIQFYSKNGYASDGSVQWLRFDDMSLYR